MKRMRSLDSGLLGLIDEAGLARSTDGLDALLEVGRRLDDELVRGARRVTERSSLLSDFERHLVRHFSEELAYLLRCACFELAQRDPESVFSAPSRCDLPDVATPAPEASATRLQRIAAQPPAKRRSRTIELALAALAGAPTPKGTISQLAAVAQALAPTNTARYYAAWDNAARNRRQASRRMLLALLADKPDAVLECFACHHLGWLAAQDGDWRQSRAWYERATRVGALVSSSFFWLEVSVRSGSRADARVAAARAAELVRLRREAVEPLAHWFVSPTRCNALRRRVVAPAGLDRVASKWIVNADPAPLRRIIHAALES